MNSVRRNFSGQKRKSDIINDEHNTLITCFLLHLYLVYIIHYSHIYVLMIIYFFIIPSKQYNACLPACVYYTHMRVHIHNYGDIIFYATCYKRPPVSSDHFC